MIEEREEFATCETCGKSICDGDIYHAYADGSYACAKHAPSLSDAILQHEEILSRVPWNPGDLPYDTRDEMKAALRDMRHQMARGGDRKLVRGGAA